MTQQARGNGHEPKTVCAVHERRLDNLESSIGTIAMELSEIRTVLGRAPDPITGKVGSGAVGIIYKIANQMLLGEPRSAFESFVDEGKIKQLESKCATAEKEKRTARIQAIGAVIVAIVAALGAVATQVIPLLKGG
jgi:hypothetical protein